MSALLFPGQGSQVVGMGAEFYNNFDFVKKIYKDADQILGFPISKIILEGPSDELQMTKNTQPAILTVSYAIFQVLKQEFNYNIGNFKCFAGHSLGEYSALVCSDSLKFSDALYLLHERGKAMQEAVPFGKGSMIAVLGSSIKKINDLIKVAKIEDSCEIANDNAVGQVILSGKKESVEIFQSILKNEKIKFIPLRVSAPFHCSLMKPAADSMSGKINKTEFSISKIDIISNVTAKVEKNPNDIKRLLIDQISSTVRWRESILNMFDMGIKNYIEIGPGKVLVGMVKRTLKDVNCFSINSITDIKNLNDKIKR